MTVTDKTGEASPPKIGSARVVADQSWLWWAGFAVCGLILSVMGLAGPAGRSADDGPVVRLVAHVPDPLIALALASGTLTALLVLSLLLPRGVRRRRKQDEEPYEFYYEPPKVPAWVMIVLFALALSPFVGAGYLLWRGWTPFGEGVAPLSPHQAFSVPPRHPFPALGGPAASPAIWNMAVTVLALCASLGSLALVLWILLGDRLARWWAGPFPERRSEMLAEAVEESLDDLAREPDARIAIIKCYRRFEQVLARSRVPRAPWQTPVEFMRAVLGRLPLPPGAVRKLTELFEVARFSNDPLGSADRSSAFESLVEIRTGLEREEEASASSA